MSIILIRNTLFLLVYSRLKLEFHSIYTLMIDVNFKSQYGALIKSWQ